MTVERFYARRTVGEEATASLLSADLLFTVPKR